MNAYRTVTSRQNPLVKEICALSDKKRRREASAFRFDEQKRDIAIDRFFKKLSSVKAKRRCFTPSFLVGKGANILYDRILP